MAHMGVDAGFWQGKRVLLTGHTGFKGSWLSLWLASMKAVVHGFALAPEAGSNLFERAGVASSLTDLRGDVRDLEAVQRACEGARPQIVMHLAAQSLVRQSYGEPVATFATNVMGTVHVLEAARQYNISHGGSSSGPIRAVVIVTTDKCYENREWVWGYRETDTLGGHDPYSSSKGCAELVAASYRRSFGTSDPSSTAFPAVATARAGNVIGGGDWSANRLVPDIIAAFNSEQAAIVRNPTAIRPWQHVLEPLSGYLMLAEKLWFDPDSYAEAWNFGPGAAGECTVGEIAHRLAKLWGGRATWREMADKRLHEAKFLKLDCSKALTQLAWRPALTLDEALSLTVDWYQADRNGSSMRDVTLAQIDTFALRSRA